ncbi:hypothetical protein N7453_011467 [Penicillium expansum]|nr:hypothetical protein N7453_011467 [Penicillium expansum]
MAVPTKPVAASTEIQGSHTELIFDSSRGTKPLNWMKTVPNEGLIHMRDTFNQSYVVSANHQALLDVMSTNTYDFEKPWRMRSFLARIIGFGMITSEGTAHKKQRKALTPAFNIKNDFARAELRCAIAGVVGRFLFEMQDPKQVIHVAGAVTIKLVEGTHLRIRRVDGW